MSLGFIRKRDENHGSLGIDFCIFSPESGLNASI